MQNTTHNNPKVMVWSHVHMAIYVIMLSTFDVAFMTGFFLLLGFTELHIAAYGSVMGMAGFLGIFGVWHAQRTGRSKRTVMGLQSSSVVFGTVAVLVGALIPGSSIMPVLVLVLMALYQFGLHTSVPVMLPWYHSLVGEHRWHGFLSTRFIVVDSVMLATTLAVGALLNNAHDTDRFLLVFLVAAAIGMSSMYFMNKIPDLAIAPKILSAKDYIRTLLSAIREKDHRVLLTIALMRSFAYGLVIPFRALFLLEQLSFNYSTISLLIGVSAAFAVVFYKVWAFFQKRFGDFTCLKWNLAMSVLDPFLWLFTTQGNPAPVYIAFVLFGMTGVLGVINAGFWSSYLGVIFQYASEGRKPIYQSLYSLAQGVAVIVAPIVSGIVIQHFNRMPLLLFNAFPEGVDGFRVVFAAAGVLLCATALFALRAKRTEKHPQESGGQK